MDTQNLILLGFALTLVAFLYSSVGHAGASGYIAAMTLCGMSVTEIKPIALTLNIFVASITSWQFMRAGHLSWRLLLPFAVTAVPFAFVGGFLNLPVPLLRVAIGSVLLLSAARLFYQPGEREIAGPPKIPVALISGGTIGLLSGFTGTGGGIFLTPVMLIMRWATTKQAAAASAVFILLNSLAGLAGNFTATKRLPMVTGLWILLVLAGGYLGSNLGSRRFSAKVIRRLLALVLLIAGSKLVFQ